MRACLKMWMQVSGPNRFLRIMVDRQKASSDADFMGSVGHELQHALEALSQPSISDGAQLYNFFRRTAPTDDKRFETVAAVNAVHAVRDELRARRPAQQQPSPTSLVFGGSISTLRSSYPFPRPLVRASAPHCHERPPGSDGVPRFALRLRLLW